MNAEDISAKICAISGKQISSGSSKIEIELLPGELFSSITAARTCSMVQEIRGWTDAISSGILRLGGIPTGREYPQRKTLQFRIPHFACVFLFPTLNWSCRTMDMVRRILEKM